MEQLQRSEVDKAVSAPDSPEAPVCTPEQSLHGLIRHAPSLHAQPEHAQPQHAAIRAAAPPPAGPRPDARPPARAAVPSPRSRLRRLEVVR